MEHSEYNSALDIAIVYDLSDFKEELGAYLDNFKTARSTWSEQNLASFPNPGLHIHHLGLITIPLSDYHTKAIAGFFSRTLPPQPGPPVDTNTRRILELPSSALELINPAWNAQLEQIVANVVKDLGIKTSVHVELCKLNLYEKDALLSNSRRDNNRKPGVFGSLVIYLSSQHDGGRIHLSHGGSTESFHILSTSGI